VEPLYLAAEKGQLPELKRVIVAFGNAIAMEQNLELALQKLFGGEGGQGPEPVAGPAEAATGAVPSDRARAMEALSHYRRGQEFLRQGNWAGYGEELKKMDEILRAIEGRK